MLNSLPNGRKAGFYDIWSGKEEAEFKTAMKEDFSQLIKLLHSGVLKPQIAAQFPLANIREAMELEESRTTYGKIVLTP